MNGGGGGKRTSRIHTGRFTHLFTTEENLFTNQNN